MSIRSGGVKAKGLKQGMLRPIGVLASHSLVRHESRDPDRIVLEGELVLKLRLDPVHHDDRNAAPNQRHLMGGRRMRC